MQIFAYVHMSHPNLLSNHVQKEATTVWLMEQVIVLLVEACIATSVTSQCLIIISVFVVNIIHSYIR